MSIAEQITQLKTDFDDVYNAGVEAGKAQGGGGVSPFYHATTLANTFMGATFPENYEFYLELEKGVPTTSMFQDTSNVKSIKLKSTINDGGISLGSMLRGAQSVETLDLSEYNTKATSLNYFALSAAKLKYILGELDLSNCTAVSSWLSGVGLLEEVRFKENTINVSIQILSAPYLSADTINSLINGLKPITDGVARTLTLNATIKGNLTDEQKATITTTKGWTLA